MLRRPRLLPLVRLIRPIRTIGRSLRQLGVRREERVVDPRKARVDRRAGLVWDGAWPPLQPDEWVLVLARGMLHGGRGQEGHCRAQ